MINFNFGTCTRTAASVVAVSLSALAAGADFPPIPPADVTATMDRDQMMSQLGISFLNLPPKLEDPHKPENAWPLDEAQPGNNWTDADGNTITRGGFGLWVTYDDKNAGDYTPIDLLKMKNGTRITTEDEWWSKRRPEMFQDVQEELWGVMPDASRFPSVSWEITTSTNGAGTEAYIEKIIVGTIDTSSYAELRNAPIIQSTLRIPANANKAVPVIIGFGGRVNGTWENVAHEGWGAASFNPNSFQPDNGAGLTSYFVGLVNKGRWRKPSDMGSLVAWAWGVGKLLDYFETDEHVDATKVGISGHSRYGKAAIVAMAYETRLAIAYPSCGGALGPSMIRRQWGQNLENLSWDREYHWTAGNIFKWMGPLKEGEYMPRKLELLPVDAHSLLALAAPRPVFLNGGTRDTWSDAPGTFLTGVAASPVYELLGKKGLIAPSSGPEVDVAYIEGDIGYRVHDGGHTPAPDWPAFVEFARKYLNKK